MMTLGAAANLTLYAGCHTVAELTNEQAVVAEAELSALDVISLALCRRRETEHQVAFFLTALGATTAQVTPN